MTSKEAAKIYLRNLVLLRAFKKRNGVPIKATELLYARWFSKLRDDFMSAEDSKSCKGQFDKLHREKLI